MSHSQSNVIDLRKWIETQWPHLSDRDYTCFATTRECIELLQAFVGIANPAYRFALTRAAKEAVSRTINAPPPKDSA